MPRVPAIVEGQRDRRPAPSLSGSRGHGPAGGSGTAGARWWRRCRRRRGRGSRPCAAPARRSAPLIAPVPLERERAVRVRDGVEPLPRSTASRTTARATSSSSGPMRAPRPHAAAHVGMRPGPVPVERGTLRVDDHRNVVPATLPTSSATLHGPRNGRPRASDPSRRCRSIARTSSPPRSVRPPSGDGPCPRRRGSRARRRVLVHAHRDDRPLGAAVAVRAEGGLDSDSSSAGDDVWTSTATMAVTVSSRVGPSPGSPHTRVDDPAFLASAVGWIGVDRGSGRSPPPRRRTSPTSPSRSRRR